MKEFEEKRQKRPVTRGAGQYQNRDRSTASNDFAKTSKGAASGDKNVAADVGAAADASSQ